MMEVAQAVLLVSASLTSLTASAATFPTNRGNTGQRVTCLSPGPGGWTDWTARGAGDSWTAEHGECALYTCQQHGAVTVHRCQVDLVPPGCALSSPESTTFPGCCPTLLCPHQSKQRPQRPREAPPALDALSALSPPSFSYSSPASPLSLLTAVALLGALPSLPTVRQSLGQSGHERITFGFDTVDEPVGGAHRPFQRVGRGPASSASSVEDEEPFTVAGMPITGKALKFYKSFMNVGDSSEGAPSASSVDENLTVAGMPITGKALKFYKRFMNVGDSGEGAPSASSADENLTVAGMPITGKALKFYKSFMNVDDSSEGAPSASSVDENLTVAGMPITGKALKFYKSFMNVGDAGKGASSVSTGSTAFPRSREEFRGLDDVFGGVGEDNDILSILILGSDDSSESSLPTPPLAREEDESLNAIL